MQSSITSFFRKSCNSTVENTVKNDREGSPRSFKQPALSNILEDIPAEETSTPELNAPEMDIANFVGKQLTDAEKMNMLRNIWIPPNKYKFPTKDTGSGKLTTCSNIVQKHSFNYLI